MAVNLKATATLNIKPYMASLKRLAAENAKLNTTAVRGSKAVVDAQERETAARERGAQRVLNNTRTMTNSTRQISRSMQQMDRSTAAYGETLGKVNRLSADNIETMSRMTQRQIALRNASESLRVARQRLADVESVSRAAGDPTALNAQRALTRADTAYTKALNARRAEVYANQELAKSERLRAQAMVNGSDAAAKQAQAFKNLTNESLNLQRAKDRLAIAEARLASAYTKSNGILTPAVASARRELASAQIGYNNLAAAQAALGKTGAAAASGLAAQRYLFRDMSRQAALASASLLAFPATAMVVAASWEKSFADVRRTADPTFIAVESKVKSLRTALVDMVQTMPVGFGAVTEIATLANQMGIASGEVASFTRAVAMFSATSGVSVDVTATAFGRLKSILGEASIPYLEMSDAILKVGVNSVATEAEIINITTQISSIAGAAGFSGKQMVALSGALASVRVPPELSRGVVTRVFGQIDKAVAANGTSLSNLARISGTTVEQFKDQWGTDQAANLFNNFLRGLREAGSGARAELEALGITSVRDIPVTLRLATAADSNGVEGGLFSQTLRDANNAAGETQRQYTIMSETVVAKLKVLGNNLLAFFDAVGQESLGPLGNIVDTLTKKIRNFTRDLDQPAGALGKMFGVTNSDALGLLTTVLLIGGGLTAVASAGLKFWQIWKTILMAKANTTIISTISGISKAFIEGAMSGGSFGTMLTTTGGKMDGVAGKAGKLGTAVAASSTKFGLIGIAIAAAIGIMAAFDNAAKKNVTSASELAEKLASIDVMGNVELDSALKGITTKGGFGTGTLSLNTKPFAGGVADVRRAVEELTKTANDNKIEWFGGPIMNEPLQWLDRTFKGQWDDVKGLEILDETVQSLVDGGNATKAIQLVQSLGMSGKQLQDTMNLDSGKNIKSFLQNAFDAAGIEMTTQSLDKLARGQLPAVTDAIYGVAGATKLMDELFDDAEGVGKFVNKLDEAAAAFIDYGAAVKAATKLDDQGNLVSFSLTDFTATLQTQVAQQQQWVADITEISRHGSSAVVESLASMGPEGKIAAMALAQGLREGTPEAIAALQALEESAAAEAGGIGNAVAEAMANQAWASKVLGSDGLARSLAASLGDDKMSQLYEAAKGVGRETQEQILQGLARDGDFEAALAALLKVQPPADTFAGFEDVAVKSFSALEQKLKKSMVIPASMELDETTTFSRFRAVIDDPELSTIDIDGNLTLTEAYAQSREFQVWAKENGVDMYLGADDTPAKLTLSTLMALADGSVSQIQIDALPDLAENEIWQVVEAANGQQAFVRINGKNGEALEDVAYVVNKATGERVAIPLTADEKEAIRKIDFVSSKARSTPAKITISAIDAASPTIDWVARNRTSTVTVSVLTPNVPELPKPWYAKADGGIMSYYADGGINSKHVAQIAPAGSMRVWAEPETEGEAYIPFARSKRTRSLAILETVAERFGYGLTKGTNVQQYAQGGFYQLQSRSTYGRMRNNMQDTGSSIEKQINVNIANPIEKHWSQDALDKIHTFGGSLDL